MNKTIFSGIQPTGGIHLGNYLGAIKQWVEMQDDAEKSIFCIVDMHAITVPQDPKVLQENILNLAALYIASGIDPEKSVLFVQSSRPEHTELAWLLNCVATMGELRRMTQFKEKTQINETISELEKINPNDEHKIVLEKIDRLNYAVKETLGNINKMFSAGVGLFDYPVLMAADILLYDATHVPVGDDQKQHVELTRDIAERFNSRYGETFTIPEPIIKKGIARIMGLDNPLKKMSKSATSTYNYIAMTDPADVISDKIKRAVTDSGSEIKASADKPAISNLLNIYSEISGRKVEKIEGDFIGKGYGDFKKALAEELIEYLKPIQSRYQELLQDRTSLIELLNRGAAQLQAQAAAKIMDVKKKMGIGINV